MTYKYLYRIGLFGDCCTGKSIFLSKYTKNLLPKTYIPTVGVDYGLKIIESHYDKDCVKVQFWDTSGSHKYKNITMSYTKKLAGAIIFYNVGYKKTFRSVERWLSYVQKYNSYTTIPTIIIATQYSDYREVSYDEGKQFAKDNNVFFTEIDFTNPQPINEYPRDILQPLWQNIWETFITTEKICLGIKKCDNNENNEAQKKSLVQSKKYTSDTTQNFFERTLQSLKEHHDDIKSECIIS